MPVKCEGSFPPVLCSAVAFAEERGVSVAFPRGMRGFTEQRLR